MRPTPSRDLRPVGRIGSRPRHWHPGHARDVSHFAACWATRGPITNARHAGDVRSPRQPVDQAPVGSGSGAAPLDEHDVRAGLVAEITFRIEEGILQEAMQELVKRRAETPPPADEMLNSVDDAPLVGSDTY